MCLVQTSVGMFQRNTFKIHTSVGANLSRHVQRDNFKIHTSDGAHLSLHVSMRHFQNSYLHELKVTITRGSFH